MEKAMAQTKFESDVLFGGKFSTSGLGSSVSSNFERTAMRRWGEEPGYVQILQQRAGGLDVKKLL